MPEGWLSFLFPSKSRDVKPKEEDPPLRPISSNKRIRIHTEEGSGSPPSYTGGLQSPSPPPSTTVTQLSASPPSIGAPLSSDSKKRVTLDDSPGRPSTSRGSPFKLPPSPASLSLPLGLPLEFETKTATELKHLIRSVPAKTLHAYLASRLSTLPTSELISLSSVLSDLEPPPLLHCVRCHREFTDVENTEHSCTVAHDDESALVQHSLSRGREKVIGTRGLETFWGCCGRTVEGGGELGPPDGWCFEGRHTVDAKRARWRDDSTVRDDKLVSCEVRGCFRVEEPPIASRSRRGAGSVKGKGRGRKRARGEDEDEDEEEDARSLISKSRSRRKASPSPSAMSVRSTRSTRRRAVSPPVSVRSVRSVATGVVTVPTPGGVKRGKGKKRARSPSVGPSPGVDEEMSPPPPPPLPPPPTLSTNSVAVGKPKPKSTAKSTTTASNSRTKATSTSTSKPKPKSQSKAKQRSKPLVNMMPVDTSVSNPPTLASVSVSMLASEVAAGVAGAAPRARQGLSPGPVPIDFLPAGINGETVADGLTTTAKPGPKKNKVSSMKPRAPRARERSKSVTSTVSTSVPQISGNVSLDGGMGAWSSVREAGVREMRRRVLDEANAVAEAEAEADVAAVWVGEGEEVGEEEEEGEEDEEDGDDDDDVRRGRARERERIHSQSRSHTHTQPQSRTLTQSRPQSQRTSQRTSRRTSVSASLAAESVVVSDSEAEREKEREKEGGGRRVKKRRV